MSVVLSKPKWYGCAFVCWYTQYIQLDTVNFSTSSPHFDLPFVYVCMLRGWDNIRYYLSLVLTSTNQCVSKDGISLDLVWEYIYSFHSQYSAFVQNGQTLLWLLKAKMRKRDIELGHVKK